MKNWKFASLIEVDKEYKIEGHNIWNFYWNYKKKKIEVINPSNRNVYYFNEYEIRTPEKTITFVAGEFSNGEIGIYLKDETSM